MGSGSRMRSASVWLILMCLVSCLTGCIRLQVDGGARSDLVGGGSRTAQASSSTSTHRELRKWSVSAERPCLS